MMFRYVSIILLAMTTPAMADEVYIDINKTNQNMIVFVDGVETYNWPVSTGRYGHDTPSGTYGTNGLHENWYSKQWNAQMPYSIFFTKRGHAIHATDKLAQLGTPASHGCVRLSMENAQTLFNLVKDQENETTVTVEGQIQVAKAPQVHSQPRGERFEDRRYIPTPRYIPPTRRRLFIPKPRLRRWNFR